MRFRRRGSALILSLSLCKRPITSADNIGNAPQTKSTPAPRFLDEELRDYVNPNAINSENGDEGLVHPGRL
jgi:hypothetical protein